LRGFDAKSDYGAAKGAVVSLTRHIAVNYSHTGIRANVIAPGFIKTGRSAHLREENSDLADTDDLDLDKVQDRTLLPYLGEPEDVASSIAFLASDRARFITGETLVVDGGWTAG
jgi:NAD(P)-dependent dehydrogenase (short-subunit alcohol dehydrogenase family)